MADWYYARNNKRNGPVSAADLKELAGDGSLRPGDLVWTEGMAEWAKAAKVKGLFPKDAPPGPSGESEARELPKEGVSARRPGQAVASPDEDEPKPRRRSDYDDDDDRPRKKRAADRYSARRRPKSGSHTTLIVLLCVGGGLAVMFVLILFIALAADSTPPRADPPFAKANPPFVNGPVFQVPPPQPIPQFQPPVQNFPQFKLQPGQKTSVDVVPIHLSEAQRSWTGKLTITDPVDIDSQGCFCKVYTYKMESGQTYVIDLESREFDSYLRLENPEGMPLLEDDDGAGNLNARISYTPNRSGLYRIIATSLLNAATGNYLLKISSSKVQMPPMFPQPPVDLPGNQVPGTLVLNNGFGFVSGELTFNDPRDVVHKNSACKVYPVSLTANTTYDFMLSGKSSKNFCVRIEDRDGKQLASSRVINVGLSPSVSFTPSQQGEYRVIVTTSANGAYGRFSLQVTSKKK